MLEDIAGIFSKRLLPNPHEVWTSHLIEVVLARQIGILGPIKTDCMEINFYSRLSGDKKVAFSEMNLGVEL